MVALPDVEDRLIVAPEVVLDTPVMVVDEAILHQNIAEMQALATSHGVSLRPHLKTHKTPEIARLQLAAGATGVTCAKLSEAEVFVDEAGVNDVLLAYPIVGPPKLERLRRLMTRAHVTVAVDSLAGAHALAEAMTAAERTLPIYVEVNTGQNRSGALAGDEAVALARAAHQLPGLRVVGVMTHEGHAGSSAPDLITAAATAAAESLVATARAIRALGIDLPVISVGSTPSSRYSPAVAGVTEMRPGTYVFYDNSIFRHSYIGPNRCAARVAATVISRPAPDRAIIDAGAKALAMDRSASHPGHGYVVGLPEAVIERVSEEHGVISLPAGAPGFAVGDRVEVIPNHICPAVNLTDELTIVRDGQVIDTWRVAARGKTR